MKGGYGRTTSLVLLLFLALAPILAATEQISIIKLDNTLLEKPEKKAESMLFLAGKAKVKVEGLLNSILTNNTLVEIIRNATLGYALEAAKQNFALGVSILELANKTLYIDGNYTYAISLAMEAMGYFRDAYKELNRILCEVGVFKDDVIKGQGLLIAIQCSLERIRKIQETLERIKNKTGINITAVITKLEDVRNILDITEAEKLLQQGNISDVAHMLAEANKLINEVFKDLKLIAREKMSEKIERFKERLGELRETVKDKLKRMNINETDFFKRWDSASSEDFWKKQIETLERVRERLRLSKEVNATELGLVNRRTREICLELEFREREGKEVKVKVEVEKIIEARAKQKVTATLKVTIRNISNITVTFPNTLFGIIIEGGRNERWEPPSAQALRSLKPSEAGEVRIRLTAVEAGNYRIVVRALSEKGLQTVATESFELP